MQIVQYKPVSVVHIVQCRSGGSGSFIRREPCWSYRSIGKQRKARQQTVSGLISVFLFYILAVLPILSRSAPCYGLFSASAYSLTFFLFVACLACYAVLGVYAIKLLHHASTARIVFLTFFAICIRAVPTRKKENIT